MAHLIKTEREHLSILEHCTLYNIALSVFLFVATALILCFPQTALAISNPSVIETTYVDASNYHSISGQLFYTSEGNICYCMHKGSSFNSGYYHWIKRYGNYGEQAILQAGYPNRTTIMGADGVWYAMDDFAARQATQVAVWSYRGYFNPYDDGSVTFYNEAVKQTARRLYDLGCIYGGWNGGTGYSMLRFSTTMTTAVANGYLDAHEDGSRPNEIYYPGFTVSSDIEAQDLSCSVVVKYDGSIVSSSEYSWDKSSGNVYIKKDFLKGKNQNKMTIEFTASVGAINTPVVLSRMVDGFQDMLAFTGSYTESRTLTISPRWVEVQYKIVNDELSGTEYANGNYDEDALEIYHIVTVPRVYTVATEARLAKDICANHDLNPSGGIGGMYYFFTDHWYTDEECTNAFNEDGQYLTESVTLYGKWLTAQIEIQNQPSIEDSPLSVGQQITYYIYYTNNNDKPENIQILDSPPVNTKYVANSMNMIRYHSTVHSTTISIDNQSSDIEANNWRTQILLVKGNTDAASSTELQDESNDEALSRRSVEETVPQTPETYAQTLANR